jgi:hypothetical protein
MAACRKGHDCGRTPDRHCVVCKHENELKIYYAKKGKVFPVSRTLIRIKSERPYNWKAD